jgi:prepilin-type N-terminal cleavage/methylation domain-containing protein
MLLTSNKIRVKISQKGFTLVETLVAIAVLMIAIAGPLVIANKALTAALYSKDQSVASYLAQEEIEIIKNARDNNFQTQGMIPTDLDYSTCLINAQCDIDMVGYTYTNQPTPIVGGVVRNCPSGGCKLYFSSAKGYSHDSSPPAIETKFARSFYITTSSGSVGNDFQVVVQVSWNEGNTPNAITLRSELTNAVR